MTAPKLGTVSFRATREVDIAVGYDEADPLAHVSADRGVYISNDGLRHADVLLERRTKKKTLNTGKAERPAGGVGPCGRPRRFARRGYVERGRQGIGDRKAEAV
ncbi:hypothetical protein DFH06DRAFT_1119446 [Mycena polygramma]|nr:hypothetical protein DFH06DRAFT_1119446 [Mycena polygramma]